MSNGSGGNTESGRNSHGEIPCEVRIFASVDLIGSTKFKNKFSSDPKKYPPGKPHWYDVIGAFYENFIDLLREEHKRHCDAPTQWELIKAIGDELMLTCVIKTSDDAYRLSEIFRNTLQAFNAKADGKDKREKGLPVKGTLWIAGFPINNAAISIEGGQKDYIGPSIDTGFRLTKFATQYKLVISVDLALLLTHCRPTQDLAFGFDGKHTLKGVLDDNPYPIIWIKAAEEDPADSAAGWDPGQCKTSVLHNYCENFLREWEKKSWLIRPYLINDQVYNRQPAWHDRIQKEWLLDDNRVTNDTDSDTQGNKTVDLTAFVDQFSSTKKAVKSKQRRQTPS